MEGLNENGGAGPRFVMVSFSQGKARRALIDSFMGVQEAGEWRNSIPRQMKEVKALRLYGEMHLYLIIHGLGH